MLPTPISQCPPYLILLHDVGVKNLPFYAMPVSGGVQGGRCVIELAVCCPWAVTAAHSNAPHLTGSYLPSCTFYTNLMA